MSIEQNKTLVRRVFADGINHNRPEVFDELIAPNYVNHDLPAPGLGPDGLRQVIALFRTAFPDMQVTVDELIAEGDRVASRGTMTGTHQGAFQGIPATGKRVAIAYMDVWRVAEGKLVENWVRLDMLALLQQLGVVPPPDAR